MKIEYAERVHRLPKYIFAAIEELKLQKRKEGIDMISLGIGDPDLLTPSLILDELVKQVHDPLNQNYPTSMGEPEFREAVKRWYNVRFHLDFDVEREVTNLIGGKEGVANIARAFINPGDIVLCPNPGYPVYENGGTKLSDGIPYRIPLLKENHFLPNFENIDTKILKKAKMLYLNYPNNPTGAIASKKFLKTAVEFAEDYNFFIIYDNPYSEFTYGDYIAPSLLEIDPSHIEINSASKMFCMTGFRCGWAVGNAKIIEGIRRIKSQIDSGCPIFIQKAVLKGLNEYQSEKKPKIVKDNIDIYEKRRDTLIQGLNKIGWKTETPKATFYVWTPIPENETNSMNFVKKLINVGVILTPGEGFGDYGQGYVRFALTQPIEKIKEAIERIEKAIND
ncbi:MAG: aminotransferase class I/II-fold pyridoxal phosphate-dependent enzyme [Candidatus Lokiarchaeota archaeon]|jgi:LL-diaminopimelate aminotransferase